MKVSRGLDPTAPGNTVLVVVVVVTVVVVDDEVEVVFGAAKELPGRLPKAIAPTVAVAVSPSFGGHARLKAPRNAMSFSCVRV